MAERSLDWVTIGETMLRLDVDPSGAPEEVDVLRLFVAGAESNVAVTLARLGLRAAWVSKLPDHVFGRRVERELRAHGVDTSRVVWDPGGRLGIYFTHVGPAPRSAIVLYDRAGSSFSRLVAEEVDWEFVGRASALHLTGITPALGPGPLAVAVRALEVAQARGAWISFDLNYRARLWTARRCREVVMPLLARCDLLICSRRDAGTVFDLAGGPEDVARALRAATGARTVCLTLGADGAGALEGERWTLIPAAPAVVVDPIGRGDAFAAGVIFEVLRGGDLAAGAALGVRLAALKQTFRGDVAWVDRAQLEGPEGMVMR
jgi:2-dehydro-3-deoxygluconokinase